MGSMLKRLRSKDKKGLFTKTQTAIGYSTGFVPFDYRNGYMVQVRDLEDEVVHEYPSTGIVGGSFITIVGKSGTAKTTFAVQIASNIVKKFDEGFVQHYDLEQALTYTRIKNITGMKNADMQEKYILKQERCFIEDIFDSIEAVATEKEANREEYMYDTGLMNEFNEPIRSYVPTVFIVDSIPTMSSREAVDGMEGGTYANRVAKALAQFYKKLTPIIKTYNIIVIAINHINVKMEMGLQKTQAQLNYMKQDESMPGGNAPIYYAHTLLKFITSGKFKEEDDGFDGFGIRCELLKSRTNKAGQFASLVYNQETGFDPIMTQYKFAEDNGLVDGRNPYRYFVGEKDTVKFDSRKFREMFMQDERIRMTLFDKSLPVLQKQLSRVDPTETAKALSEMEVMQRLGVKIIGEHDEQLDWQSA